MFSGVYVAMVTPFSPLTEEQQSQNLAPGERVDYAQLEDLIMFHMDHGTTGIIPCGTTGEAATLSPTEKRRIFERCVQVADKQLQVIAGTGTNNTAQTIELTQAAKEAGCDGALLVTPYYNKPTQEGLYRHYRAVAQAVDIPLMLYNVPSRTSCNMLPETVIRLRKEFDNIVAVKEASGILEQVTEIRRGCDIAVLSGDDALTLPILSLGGTGVVSVIANILPEELMDLVNAFSVGNVAEARRIHERLYPFCKAMFIETNPVPVKTAMYILNRLTNADCRLPLAPLSKANHETLSAILREFGMTADI